MFPHLNAIQGNVSSHMCHSSQASFTNKSYSKYITKLTYSCGAFVTTNQCYPMDFSIFHGDPDVMAFTMVLYIDGGDLNDHPGCLFV